MKHSPPEFKAYILRKKGNITARVVRTAIKEWPYIKYQIEKSKDIVEVTESPEIESFDPIVDDEPIELPKTNAALINEAIQNMVIISERDLEPTDVLLVDKFVSLMEKLVDQIDDMIKGEEKDGR